jgi:hypothetical protein
VGFSLHVAAYALWQQLYPALKAYESGVPMTDEQEVTLRLRGPFAMLSGMSIENMLKGVVVQKGLEPPQTHDLVKLSKQAGIKWERWPDASGVLARLTTFVVWAGRYPVATTEEGTSAPRILRTSDYLAISQIRSHLTDIHFGRAPTPQ